MHTIGFADFPPDIFRVILGDPAVGPIELTVLRETSNIFTPFIPRHPIRKKWICAEAARVGNTPIVRWGYSIGCPLNSASHASAVHGGHHDTVRWIETQKWLYDDSACKFMAITSGLTVVRWTLSHGYPRYPKLHIIAAKIGNLELLNYAIALKYKWDDRICVIAARYGYLNILEYSCSWKGHCTRKSPKSSSRSDIFMMLKLHDPPCAFLRDVCAEAAAGGHLQVLKWAYDQGFHIDNRVYTAAFTAGHLDVVQWLHTVIPIDKPSLFMPAAIRGGNAAAIKWLGEIDTNLTV